MHQGLEDVPALLSGGGDDGTHSGEVVGTPLGAEATGDFLAQLGHSEVTFGLIVRKRRARVGEESQASLLVLAETEREVMTDAAFLSSALAGPERRLRLMEGDGVVEDAGPGPRDPGPQGGGHVAAVLTGEAGSPVCALKEADDRLVLIKVRPETVSDRGLYEAVRRSWVVKRERVETADYVLAIVRGVCRGVFQAYEWRQSPGRDKRWEFEGREVQGDVAARYVEKLIPPDKRKPGMAAPVLYVGC